jgi:phosphoglucomutase
MGLLAAEILAKTGRDPSQFFGQLTSELGVPFYERIDVPATAHQKNALKKVGPDQLSIKELAGDPVARRESRRRAMARPSAESRSRPKWAGLLQGLPELKTFRRSTLKASATKII